LGKSVELVGKVGRQMGGDNPSFHFVVELNQTD
jgi:hypothetical protein